MSRIMAGIYSNASGTMQLVADWSSRIQGLKFSSADNGYEAASGFVPLPKAETFAWLGNTGFLFFRLSVNGEIVWDGRLEDVSLKPNGISFTAFGHFRAFSDIDIPAMVMSKATFEGFRPARSTEVVARTPERYEMKAEGGELRISPKKGEIFAANDTAGEMVFQFPSRSITSAKRIQVVGTFNLPTGWYASLNGYNSDFTGATQLALLASNGTTLNINWDIIAAGFQIIGIYIYPSVSVPGGWTSPTGDHMLRCTRIRINGVTIPNFGAETIAQELLTYINGINPNTISASGGLLPTSTGLDLFNEVYEDTTAADILRRIAAFGDSSGNSLEVGVFNDQLLYMRPRGTGATAYMIDASTLEIENSVEPVANSVYTAYKDPTGRIIRNTPILDRVSINKRGFTRRRGLVLDTTDAVVAGYIANSALNSLANPSPRAAVTFTRIFDAQGNLVPLWRLRAGDTLTIRNLTPDQINSVGIQSFRLARVEYDVDAGTVAVEPENPIPSFEVFLAQEREGY